MTTKIMTIVEFGEKYATPQCQDKKNMCYVYIHTCNRNESLINKIKTKSNQTALKFLTLQIYKMYNQTVVWCS